MTENLNSSDWRFALEAAEQSPEKSGRRSFQANCPVFRPAPTILKVTGDCVVEWKPGYENVDVDAAALEEIASSLEELAHLLRLKAQFQKNGHG